MPLNDEYEIAYYGGRQKVRVGDVVKFALGQELWTVGEPSGGRIYSPSGLGGTPCFRCTPIGEMPEWARKYIEPDGSVVMCGDSIAAALSREHPSE